jgi:hypothetical protein
MKYVDDLISTYNFSDAEKLYEEIDYLHGKFNNYSQERLIDNI